jgi:type IV pilus assembly protein PilY1
MKAKLLKRFVQLGGVIAIALLCLPSGWAGVELEDRPTSAGSPQPNMLFTPSVEYPTVVTRAHKDINRVVGKDYLGYFDTKKCYTYNTGQGYFEPSSFAGTNHSCPAVEWSGRDLNYATMGAIDIFRWALTGGARIIDTAATATAPGITVLRRSYQINDGNVSGSFFAPPNGWNTTLSSIGQGEKVAASNRDGTFSYNVHVRVCDNRKGDHYLEDNCVAYKDPATGVVTYKPVGLIQRHQDKVRFGVFSYLLNQAPHGKNVETGTSDIKEMDGGVLRARLKSVGPQTRDGQVNNNREWDPATGVFIKNPDTVDAAGSYGGAVSKSGVINYLNDFGFDSKSYQRWDQPSEMYAEALRYLMKLQPTSLYYQPASTGKPGEGFPVITDWWKNGHDSILSSCQKTAIVGIGDVNTHREQKVDAGEGNMQQKAKDGMVYISNKEGINVALECWGDGKNSECTDGGSNKIAGLAYYAHNNNLRPDLTAGKKDAKVTASTYWIDVMEKAADFSRSRRISSGEHVDKNQYWLATKYGGMDSNGVWDKRKRVYTGINEIKYPIPDNYYPAGDPEAMIDGLTDIFIEVLTDALGTGAGAGWISNSVDGNVAHYYQARYSVADWSGALEAYGFEKFNADGSVVSKKLWDAADKIDGQNWDTGRRIVTYAKQPNGSYKGVPFRFDNLTEAQKKSLGGDEAARKAVLNYLRGDKTLDSVPGYRKRKTLLGDIVHSKPVEVGKPDADYSDDKNPGYLNFKEAQKARSKVVYVGANDGMLHAIKGINGSSSDGTELWAYVPSFLFEGPDNPKNPEASGLRALTRSMYSHRYYVNATPVVQDVDFHHTRRLNGSLPAANKDSADWRTLLVSGLGKGGKGFFALDVTDPSATSETAAASKVLWEFPRLEGADSDMLEDISDMGFSFGQPLITKTKAWGWVVVLTSGYNNNSGKGVLYILNAKTGERLAKVETEDGTTDQEAGFAQLSGFTPSYADYTTHQIYGGDLLGNLWRFDLTGTSLSAPFKIAKLTDGQGNPQPITAAPIIEVIENGASSVNGSRWVIAGTGQWLSSYDVENGSGTQTQTMYAIRDGKFDATKITSTVLRGDLTQVTDLSTGLDNESDKGWYYDMKGSIGASKERVTFPAAYVPNTLVWTGIIPQSGRDDCRPDVPDGESRIYAVDLATGKSIFSYGSEDGGYYELDSLTVDLEVVKWMGGIYAAGMTSKGEAFTLPKPLSYPKAGLSRSGVINWRTVE